MKSRSLFWQTILDTIQDQCRLVPYEQMRLLPASLGDHVGIAGAAAAWLNRQHPDKPDAESLHF
jgi:hypothetical protein